MVVNDDKYQMRMHIYCLPFGCMAVNVEKYHCSVPPLDCMAVIVEKRHCLVSPLGLHGCQCLRNANAVASHLELDDQTQDSTIPVST